jgi:hypothetical protein
MYSKKRIGENHGVSYEDTEMKGTKFSNPQNILVLCWFLWVAFATSYNRGKTYGKVLPKILFWTKQYFKLLMS